jgi:hypothetical protein
MGGEPGVDRAHHTRQGAGADGIALEKVANEIARLFGVTHQSMSLRLKKMGITRPGPQVPLAAWDLVESGKDGGRRVLSSAENWKRSRAIIAVQTAVRKGHLVRQPCEGCGEPKTQGHHDDYDKPVDVRWRCLPCHQKWQRSLHEEACRKPRSREKSHQGRANHNRVCCLSASFMLARKIHVPGRQNSRNRSKDTRRIGSA